MGPTECTDGEAVTFHWPERMPSPRPGIYRNSWPTFEGHLDVVGGMVQ